MSWAEVPFDSLYLVPSKNGLTRPSRVRGSGFKMINMGELFANDRIRDIDMERVPMNQKELATMLVEPGDLLFARQSLVLAGAGKCSLVKEVDEQTTFESHIIRVRLNNEIAHSEFYYYYIKSPKCRIRSIVTQGVQAGIRGNDLKALIVHLPPMVEQRQIASVLTAYDDLIENNRRRIQLLEKSAQLLYKEWFVHLRFPGHEHTKIIDGVPEGWRRTCLGDLCKLRAGDTFKPKYQGRREGDLPFIKVRDLSRDGNAIAVTGADNWVTLDECEEFRGKPFSKGTSVFAKIGEGLRQNRVRFIVRDTLIDNNMMGAISDQGVAIGEYLYFLLHEQDLANYAGGAAIPFLSSKVLENVGVLAPPMQLLLLFQAAVAPMLQQVVNLEHQSAAAAKARDLLLPKLMNGDIAV